MSKKPVKKINFVERIREKLPALLVLAVVVGGVLVFIYQSTNQAGSAALVDVKVPALSAIGTQGKTAFAKNCAQCHGDNAAGGQGGPPLIHKIYNPGHHADGAFWLAMQRGVSQHHWRFGNMPPQPQVGEDVAKAIIAYVRELQAANGISYQPHRMN
ncbi:MAG: cytochrome c [Proteobacteria bacterium]|nr:cytochrome c [Pseudomonadota bacterium]